MLREYGSSVLVRTVHPAGYAWNVLASVLVRILPRAPWWVGRWTFRTPRAALRDADIVVFPWAHRHARPAGMARTIGVLHDMNTLRQAVSPADVPWRKAWNREERASVQSWLCGPCTGRVVCISQVTKTNMAEIFGARANAAVVVHNGLWPLTGVNDLEWLRGVGLEKPYLIYPSNFSPHKNHERLIEAYARVRPARVLVFSGSGADFGAGKRGQVLRRFCERHGLVPGRDVKALGYVSRGQYETLLQNCCGLLYPSTAEGFGIPVVEAHACGLPVACSDLPVFREAAAAFGIRAKYFDSLAVDSIAVAVRCLADRAASELGGVQPRSWSTVWSEYQAQAINQ